MVRKIYFYRISEDFGEQKVFIPKSAKFIDAVWWQSKHCKYKGEPIALIYNSPDCMENEETEEFTFSVVEINSKVPNGTFLKCLADPDPKSIFLYKFIYRI